MRSLFLPLLFCTLFFATRFGVAQALPYAQPDNTMKVMVTMNSDGSKTTYQTDPQALKTTATTTEPDGKLRGKIIYTLDSAGRYLTGEIFGSDAKLRFRASYTYDESGRLKEEKQLSKDEKLLSRIVYQYGADGKPAGFSTYDPNGRLINGPAVPNVATAAARPAATPKPTPPRKVPKK